MKSSKLHIKLTPDQTNVILQTARLLNVRPEDLALQSVLHACAETLKQMQAKMAALEATPELGTASRLVAEAVSEPNSKVE